MTTYTSAGTTYTSAKVSGGEVQAQLSTKDNLVEAREHLYRIDAILARFCRLAVSAGFIPPSEFYEDENIKRDTDEPSTEVLPGISVIACELNICARKLANELERNIVLLEQELG